MGCWGAFPISPRLICRGVGGSLLNWGFVGRGGGRLGGWWIVVLGRWLFFVIVVLEFLFAGGGEWVLSGLKDLSSSRVSRVGMG